MPRPKNNGSQKGKLLILGPTPDLPKFTSLTWDYYKCVVDTDKLRTNGILQVPIGTTIDRVRSTAMHSHAKLASELSLEFDPFNASITITKINLPQQNDDD
jgi:hypothetical protein